MKHVYIFRLLLLALLTTGSFAAQAQTGGVGIGTTAPDASAKLDVLSATQGFLPPRMRSSQREAIASPAAGLMVFQSDGTVGMYYYTGTNWVNLTNGYVPDANGSTASASGMVSTLAGLAGSSGYANGTGAQARFSSPSGVAVSGGTVYVADESGANIRRISTGGAMVSVGILAGSDGFAAPGSADGTGTAARFNRPAGVAVGGGMVYVADQGNHTIRKITASGVVSTLAGTALSAGSANGTGTAARFNSPAGVAADGSGTVYVADELNHTIRKITASGVVSTLAGQAGSSGSADGTGTAARFNRPTGVAVDGSGTVYVADQNNGRIRKITPLGVVSTLAGTFNVSSVAVDAAHTLYVCEQSKNIITRITASGVVSTLAGQAGSSGSADGTGAEARFNGPTGVAVDSDGKVYVADRSNSTIRIIQ